MKNWINFLGLIGILCIFFLSSCQTRLVDARKPLRDNTLELYKNYRVTTKDAKTMKMNVLKVDSDKIYGKLANGELKEIDRSDVHEVKKTDYLSTVLIAIAAAAAVIFIPI